MEQSSSIYGNNKKWIKKLLDKKTHSKLEIMGEVLQQEAHQQNEENAARIEEVIRQLQQDVCLQQQVLNQQQQDARQYQEELQRQQQARDFFLP
jgi:reverse gyrase